MADRPFVVTSTDAGTVKYLAGDDPQVTAIVGKPFDLDVVITATSNAARFRDSP
jgi:hypothetical protein